MHIRTEDKQDGLKKRYEIRLSEEEVLEALRDYFRKNGVPIPEERDISNDEYIEFRSYNPTTVQVEDVSCLETIYLITL